MQTTKRQAYDLTLRCRLNGCEWSARLFLRSADDAFEALYRRARFSMRDHERKLASHWFYLTRCEVSADQSRPIG
ncbi:hypothetical protein JQ617_07945 [Bradyrhizobium sp. KB893862 SZCCT0404]|uniref:hypothetical protein n=1 Tax=Bradyrhizobium sp. KB893862 SZCCT0404 TaxID=2807672 RepID=UPI001BA50998|nr:hypothetical protein [Bradyrhizobium sp. KB893862 SZCCT0404]MBR1173882.1 hypothetical protein [Bradyrhizobium sp. KB893862 SZCCT0404]